MTAHLRPGLLLLALLGLLASAACGPAAAPASGGAARAPAPAPSGPQSAAPDGPARGAPAPAASAPAAPPVPIKVAFSQVAAAFAPLWIAQEHGLFRKHGLDAEVVNLSKPADIQALLNGDVQITVNGSAGIDAIAGGANLVYVAAPLPVYTQAVYGQPSVGKMSDLIGLTVAATSQGGSSDNALRSLLAREGIDPAQVNITYLRDDATLLAALTSGTVHAAILTSPNTLRAREAGFREVVDTVPLNLRTVNNAIIVRRDWAQQNEGLVLSFLRAYLEAIKEGKTNPEATKAIVGKYTHLDDPALLDEAYKTASGGWVVYPLLRDPDVQNVIDLSPIPEVKARKPSDYYDNSYLQRLESFARSLDPTAAP